MKLMIQPSPFTVVMMSLCALLMMVSAVNAEPAASPSVKFPLPGNSIAAPNVQHDAFLPGLAAAKTGNPTCKTYTASDLAAVSTSYAPKVPNAKKKNAPWTEIWSYTLCGKVVRVPITFLPKENKTTGAITIISLIRSPLSK